MGRFVIFIILFGLVTNPAESLDRSKPLIAISCRLATEFISLEQWLRHSFRSLFRTTRFYFRSLKHDLVIVLFYDFS